MRPPPSVPTETHPALPDRAWVVVLQPRAEPYRLAFDPASRTFRATSDLSRLHERGFDGVYGWISGLGEPPGEHLPALVLTRDDPQPGDLLEAGVHGLMRRAGGRSVVLAIDTGCTPAHGAVDLTELPLSTRTLLARVPAGGASASWLDGADARRYLLDALRRHRTRERGAYAWPDDPDAWAAAPEADDGPWPW